MMMWKGKKTAQDMRKELARICDEVPTRSCGSRTCKLAKLCAVFGNPRTTDAESVKAMYNIIKSNQKG